MWLQAWTKNDKCGGEDSLLFSKTSSCELIVARICRSHLLVRILFSVSCATPQYLGSAVFSTESASTASHDRLAPQLKSRGNDTSRSKSIAQFLTSFYSLGKKFILLSFANSWWSPLFQRLTITLSYCIISNDEASLSPASAPI